MDPSQTLFMLRVDDGYAFRSALHIAKNEIDKATLILSKDFVEISFVNNIGSCAHKMIIRAADTSQYFYNFRDKDGELLPEAALPFDVAAINAAVKTVGRKDGLCLYLFDGDDRINIRPLKTTKDPRNMGALFVKITNDEKSRYDDSGLHYTENPSLRLQAKAFADICTKASTMKCKEVIIQGSEGNAKFIGISSDNIECMVENFGSQLSSFNDDDAEENPELDAFLASLRLEPASNDKPKISLNIISPSDSMKVRVPIVTMKSLSKIHNISPTGAQIKLFFSEGLPVKMESLWSTYGTYEVYLRGTKPK